MKAYQTTIISSSDVPKKKWYEIETSTELILPVSIDSARDRMKKAVASTIVVSKGFWSPRLEYAGSIDGYNFFGAFTVYDNRNTKDYNIYGQLVDNEGGCVVNISVRDSGPVYFCVTLVIIMAFIFIKENIALAILIGIILGIIFPVVESINHSKAVKKINSLVENIILDRPLDF